MLLTAFFLACILYSIIFTVLWGWSAVHALMTPHEDWSRRALWTAAMAVNPVTAMWYWYVWKRWAFWTLFIPLLAFMLSLPFALEALIRAFTVRDIADRFVHVATLLLQNVIDVIPFPLLLPLVVFPFILRLAALTHLGGNSQLKAADRNDYAIAFALPFFGFGGALGYCFKWRRAWATAGLVWFFVASATAWGFVRLIGER